MCPECHVRGYAPAAEGLRKAESVKHTARAILVDSRVGPRGRPNGNEHFMWLIKDGKPIMERAVIVDFVCSLGRSNIIKRAVIVDFVCNLTTVCLGSRNHFFMFSLFVPSN